MLARDNLPQETIPSLETLWKTKLTEMNFNRNIVNSFLMDLEFFLLDVKTSSAMFLSEIV